MEDLYSILWIEKTAPIEEIKKAYRKLAMQHHPDRWWDETRFKEINTAYAVLSDNEKRKQYDMFWMTGNIWWFSGFEWFDIDLGDIMDSFFGWWFSSNFWTRIKKKESKWEDLQYVLKIDLKTAIFWWKERINFNKRVECPTCHWEWWSGKKTCQKCGGEWKIVYSTQSIFGTIQQTVVCDVCGWSGEVFENICNECHWEKRIVLEKELEIDIPAGINDGMIIKLIWEWNDGIWTKAKWDLYVKFEVPNEEKWLKRDWVDLYYEIDVEVVQAILWTNKEINIPIIWKRKIEIKAWTESWSIIKIAWDWVKYLDRDRKWDLLIEINIKIPKKLSKIERELYEKIAKEKGIEVNGKKGIFGKVFG